MSARQSRPTITLERIERRYELFGAALVKTTAPARADGTNTIRPTVIEVQEFVEQNGVKVTVSGFVVDDGGDETGQLWNTSWFHGGGFAPELLERAPLSAAPRWVRDLVDEITG